MSALHASLRFIWAAIIIVVMQLVRHVVVHKPINALNVLQVKYLEKIILVGINVSLSRNMQMMMIYVRIVIIHVQLVQIAVRIHVWRVHPRRCSDKTIHAILNVQHNKNMWTTIPNVKIVMKHVKHVMMLVLQVVKVVTMDFI